MCAERCSHPRIAPGTGLSCSLRRGRRFPSRICGPAAGFRMPGHLLPCGEAALCKAGPIVSRDLRAAFSACPFSGRPAKKSGYPHSAPCTGVHSAKKSGFLGLFERGRLKKESLRPAMNGELNGTRARSYRTRASEIDRPFEGASIKTIPAALASAPLCGAGEGRRGAGHATAPWTAAPVSEPGGKELAAREMRPAVGKRNTQGLLPAISFFADRSLSLCRPDCP